LNMLRSHQWQTYINFAINMKQINFTQHFSRKWNDVQEKPAEEWYEVYQKVPEPLLL
jgi:hypothetical protein